MSSESDYCTRVFWDVVDFPFPKGLAPETIYHKMKLILEKLGCIGDLLIMAYVNNSETFPDKSAYAKAGISIIHQRERHRYMLRDIAWWEVDSTFTPSFRPRGQYKITFMVILSQIEKESAFLTFLENLKMVGYNVRLAVPHDTSPSPNLLDAVSFEWLYQSLLQTVTVPDPNRMTITREDVPLYYPPIQTTRPSLPNEPFPCPGVFMDLPEWIISYSPFLINSYLRRRIRFSGHFSVMTYVDDTETSFLDRWVNGLAKLGITIILQQRADIHADIHARARRMSVDIVLWAIDNPANYFQPRDLLVLSENFEGTDFYNALEALGDRYYNVQVCLTQDLHTHWLSPKLCVNHWPDFSREEAVGSFHGIASLYKQNLNMCEIHVFWDVQGCPTDLPILPVLRKKGYYGRVLLRPYLDKDYQRDEPLLDYRDDGYARVPSIKVQGDKYTKVARMLLDMLFWAMNHDNLPQNLMIISQPSKDIDIVIQALERRCFNVIFKPSDEFASHTIDHFESLCKSPPDAANQTVLESPWRTITDVTRKLKFCSVIIFWLVDSCPSSPYVFLSNFSSTLEYKGYGNYLSVTAYVEKGKNSDEVIKACSKSGLGVVVTPADDEFGRFNSMLLDMINWTQASGAPFNFLVISKPFRDALCDTVFEDVKNRGFNVLFETVDYMVTFGSSLWSSKSILDTSFSGSSQALLL